MSKVLALINKETLRLIREKTQVSFDYLSRMNNKNASVIQEWEDTDNPDCLPSIPQAKKLAYSLHVPFAGLYMPPHLIPIPSLPNLHNKRTMPGGTTIDNSRLNLAIIDMLTAREFLIETSKELSISHTAFSLSMKGSNIKAWAGFIRSALDLSIKDQYKCGSPRQYYLYLRKKVENAGALIQCFSGIPVEEVQEADNPLLCLWDNILCHFLLSPRAVPPVCGFLACCQRDFAPVVSAYVVLVLFGLLAD